MANDIERLRQAVAAKMQELGAAPGDPRLAPLLAQMQALMQQHIASAGGVVVPFVPRHAGTRHDHGGQAAAEAIEVLPVPLKELVQGYIREVQAGRPRMPGGASVGGWFHQAPALSASVAGNKLLNLAPAAKACVAVATYAAWTSERFGGPDGAALLRIVSDLLRAK